MSEPATAFPGRLPQAPSPAPMPVSHQPSSTAGPSAPRVSSRTTAKSSRRTRGSAGPNGLLGAGPVAYGNSTFSQHQLHQQQQKQQSNAKLHAFSAGPSPFYAQPSPTSPLYPVQFASSSPTAPGFPPNHAPTGRLPSAPATIQSQRAPSPLAASGPKIVPVQHGSQNGFPGSTSSLSTAASTSSRTLKTPQSKLDAMHQSPHIAGSSSMGSHEGFGSFGSSQQSPTPAMPLKERQMQRTEQRSPTPTQRSVSAPMRAPVPAPINYFGSRYEAELQGKQEKVAQTTSRRAPPPAPLSIPPMNKGGRLSQDWVEVNVPNESRQKSISPLLPEPAPMPANPRLRNGSLPAPQMVPIKSGDSAPSRPSMNRTASGSLLNEKAQKKGRISLDNLRSKSPKPSRSRGNSLSTPPAAVFDDEKEKEKSSGSLFNMFRSGRKSEDVMRVSENQLRRSQDLLRPSEDSARPLSKKESKARAKEMQRSLGVANGAMPGTTSSLLSQDWDDAKDKDKEGRKASGLSLKKSSGALKALFNRTKGKEREQELANLPSRPSGDFASFRNLSAPAGPPVPSKPRPSLNLNRAKTPEPVVAPPPEPEKPKRQAPKLDLLDVTGHARALYPSRVSAADKMRKLRPELVPQLPDSISKESLPFTASSSMSMSGSSSATPSLVVTEHARTGSWALGSANSVASLPKSSNDNRTLEPSDSASDSLRSSSPRLDVSPTPPLDLDFDNSRWLHFLQMPDLDLGFDITFDKIGKSPSTPRLSPGRGGSPGSISPQRSLTMRASPSSRSSPRRPRSSSDRRRSLSFDGENRPSADLFTGLSRFETPDFSKGYTTPPETCTTKMATPLGPGSSVETPDLSAEAEKLDRHVALVGQSSSRPCTPSNTSSTNETHSPSSPLTPEEDEGSPEFPRMPRKSTPKVPVVMDRRVLTAPPNIPLPALPPMPTTVATAQPASFGAPVALAPPVELSPPRSESRVVNPEVVDKAVQTPAPIVVKPLDTTLTTVASPSANVAAVKPVEVKPTEPSKPVVRGPRPNKRVLTTRSVGVQPDPSFDTFAIARELERTLYTFRAPATIASVGDKVALLRNDLLPLLAEIDHRPHREDIANKALREQCFSWIEQLLKELKIEQSANERGACLESLASVVESSCLSEKALAADAAHRKRFTNVMMRLMTFVMDKLGAKGVFHNTLLFSGRFLAFAFFRVPHVGEQLVTVLPPPRGALLRFTRAPLLGAHVPPNARPQYPKHLVALCYDDAKRYTARLNALSADFDTEEERDAFLFQPGNWLRRWQSDDSELFPAFYRAYHRQLALYLAPALEYYEILDQPIPPAVLLSAPGYAHFATIFAKKCHSYILGSINAVTTSSAPLHFEATETAGFRGSQKPAVLETANRRLVETMWTFANMHVLMPLRGQVIEADGQQLYGSMLDVWTKNLITKTSLYAPKGVFSLFDLLDGLVDPPVDHMTGERRLTEPSLLDVPYLIHVIRLVLTEGEHALTLVKVIAFIFTHWEVLTARSEDRKELCLELLLEKELFERLLLFWSQSVRSYVVRLVVFRLGHVHTTQADGVAHSVEIESVRLLQTRLDRIKKRHDELEPKAVSESDDKDEPYLSPLDGGNMPRSRSTITMIPESPHAQTGSINKAERLLGLGLGSMEKGGEIEEPKKKGMAWFKKGFGKQKRRKSEMGDSPASSYGDSPRQQPLGLGSPLMPPERTPEMRKSPLMQATPLPQSDSPASSKETGETGESNSSSGEGERAPAARKGPPPMITTTLPPTEQAPDASPSSYAFEFELPTASPRSDTFDPTPVPSSPNGSTSKRNSAPPSPHQPASPHMSRSFSKRSSLLPPKTASLLAGETTMAMLRLQVPEEVVEEGYDRKLHAYAVRMLAELEDAEREYDEWWSEGGIGTMDGAPPKLTVAWPFHDGEE